MCRPTDSNASLNKETSGGSRTFPSLAALVGTVETAVSMISKSVDPIETAVSAEIPNQIHLEQPRPCVLESSGQEEGVVTQQTGETTVQDEEKPDSRRPSKRKRFSPNDVAHMEPTAELTPDKGPRRRSARVPREVSASTSPLPPEQVETKASKPRRSSRRRSSSGTTKGHHERAFVNHSYHDYADAAPESGDTIAEMKEKRGGGTNTPFPLVLHRILENAESDGYSDIVSWQPHGRAFLVHHPDKFVSQVMPRHFRQTRFSSFQRQLSLYGFLRLTRKGPDNGAYYHQFFLRGKEFLCRRMPRTRVKGYWVRQSSSPDTEPDFYHMSTVGDQDAAGRPDAAVEDAGNIEPFALSSVQFFAEPWSIPMQPQVISSAARRTEIPPMPPLEAYRQSGAIAPVLWPMTEGKVDIGYAGVPETSKAEARGTGPGVVVGAEADLAEFLSDVDLDSDGNARDEVFEGEEHMAKIHDEHTTKI